MKRRSDEVNTRTTFVTSFFFFVVVATIATVATSCGGAERHADRLWRQAIEYAGRGDTSAAVNRLQQIIDRYPDARAAEKARSQIVVYRGLLAATEAYPSRRARELMVQIARAIETFRNETGHVPARLDELVPTRIERVPIDPWHHPFSYEASAKTYTLRCLGAEGSKGGTADAADLIVVDGAFTQDRQ